MFQFIFAGWQHVSVTEGSLVMEGSPVYEDRIRPVSATNDDSIFQAMVKICFDTKWYTQPCRVMCRTWCTSVLSTAARTNTTRMSHIITVVSSLHRECRSGLWQGSVISQTSYSYLVGGGWFTAKRDRFSINTR